MSPTILVTGANGQLGTVLVAALTKRYGTDRVIASDIRPALRHQGRFELLDVTDEARLTEVVRTQHVSQIYHLAAILSASGEANPIRTWQINMDALLNVLEVSRKEGINKVFYPSSIAVFGEGAPLDETPHNAYLDPLTVYGISKAAGENWAQYYWKRYGLDVRSLRYPGVIGHQSDPGGGTTDYAVEIFHEAVQGRSYECFLQPGETLPMIFMDDAIRATMELMEAPVGSIKLRTSYNIAGASFSPAEITRAIQEYYPEFTVNYAPDYRQEIAAKWPNSIDDSQARQDWGWKPTFDLNLMVETMVTQLRKRYAGFSSRESNAAA